MTGARLDALSLASLRYTGWPCHMEAEMKKTGVSRRGFIATAVAAAGARFVPVVATKLGGRRILELVVDKATGTLRAVERLVD